ncbi:hypothetical protein [Primorskyibacter sp. S187A]|uniref:hypothetical protein n=1 Tax=Primorskyibacter sp. S187A TaxID=3415130 RepID=UPI003C7A5B4F
MGKFTTFFALLVLSMLAAGLFGAGHNQLSYSVGPSYFHDLKFEQFGIAPEQHNRWGAALVGWRASWWMGLIVGLPAFLFGLFAIARPQTFLAAGIGAIGAVIFVTMVAALAGLAFGMIFVDDNVATTMELPEGLSDPVGYVRAGLMHDLSYFGGLAGALVALWTMWRTKKMEEKHHAA